jgi:16S rRNA (uracil1498-N3)-methyltransferase
MVKWQECQMQRYFVSEDAFQGSFVRLTGEEVHHIRNVMRFQPDDQIIVCKEDGMDYLCSISEINRNEILCEVVEKRPSKGEPKTRITVAPSLVRSNKLEWIIQKGTEIGAVSFQPFCSERSLIHIDDKKERKKRERWQRIAKEAAEQSHRGKVPAVLPALSWKEFLAEMERFPLVLIAYEKGGVPIRQAMAGSQADEIMLVTGPEGGFTEAEIDEAKARGAVPVTLGNRILRAETAPLVALSCILFARHELGGETQ